MAIIMAIMAIHPVSPNQNRTAEAILRVVSEPADLSNADAPDLAPADATHRKRGNAWGDFSMVLGWLRMGKS